MAEWIYQGSLMNNGPGFYVERSKIISMCKLECDEDDDRKENEEPQGESEVEKGDHETPEELLTLAKETPKSKTGKGKRKANKKANIT